MSKIGIFKLSKLSKSHKAIKTNKLLLKYKFYNLKVFEQIFRNRALVRWEDTDSETLIERVNISSWPIVIASDKKLGTFRIEAGGH